MTEDKRGSWLIGGMQVRVRLTMRCVHLELRQAGDADSPDPYVSARVTARHRVGTEDGTATTKRESG
jgi:hypothetical protein